MPGVIISTSVRTGPSTATVRESSQLFIVGLASRGPANTATLVQSIADFEDIFGGRSSFCGSTNETWSGWADYGNGEAFLAKSTLASAAVMLVSL